MIEEEKEIVVLYHKGCPDGFGAAFACWKKFGDTAIYHPISHKDPIPDVVIGKTVFMVDFAFKLDKTLKIKKLAKQLIILDHHISQYEELKDVEGFYFDNNHSGAVLAWKYFFPNIKVPSLLRYVEDRDLWKFELIYSKEILVALDTLPYSFLEWDKFSSELDEDLIYHGMSKEEPVRAVNKGSAILEYKDALVNRLIHKVYFIEFDGYKIPVINMPVFQDDILNKLALDFPFAMAYHYHKGGFSFSLRSNKDSATSVNVAEIATRYPEGGGHAAAAGFTIETFEDLQKFNLDKLFL